MMPSGKKIEVPTRHKAKAPRCIGLEGFFAYSGVHRNAAFTASCAGNEL